MLSIHADAYTQSHAKGFGVFVLDDSDGSPRSQEIIKDSLGTNQIKVKDLAHQYGQTLLDGLSQNYILHSKNPTPMPLVILRSPKTASLLLELGFVSNPDDASRLVDLEYTEKLATDVAEIVVTQIFKDLGLIAIKRY